MEYENLSKGNSEINRIHYYLRSKYPSLIDIEPKILADTLREYNISEEASFPYKFPLDQDIVQNIRNEMRKTYHENNVDYLINGRY